MSDIEWTGVTWNVGKGCRRVSPGCGRAKGQGGCYAERLAIRMSGPGGAYEGLVESTSQGPRWTGKVRFDIPTLEAPLHWRMPRTVFANSMSDLFHDGFTFEQIAATFGVMAVTPQHTYQVLTKREKRMRAFFQWLEYESGGRTGVIDVIVQQAAYKLLGDRLPLHKIKGTFKAYNWPLANVHMGVSVENQKYVEERVPELLAIPAAVRFVSYEPALGPINLYAFLKTPERDRCLSILGGQPMPGLDWVIAGAESGPGAFPFEEDWARTVRDECAAAGVAFFYKQKLDSKGRKVSLPMLDGVQHAAMPVSS